MISFLLIVHAVVGAALLGAITHQAVSMLRRHRARSDSFLSRYSGVGAAGFTYAIASLYVVQVAIGALVYPAYRLNVRIPFEEMSMGWAVGLFEIKEHFAGIGLALLPLYVVNWRRQVAGPAGRDRVAITLLLTLIVWWDFLVGHVLDNIRGLG
jgi:hypothetical protein